MIVQSSSASSAARSPQIGAAMAISATRPPAGIRSASVMTRRNTPLSASLLLGHVLAVMSSRMPVMVSTAMARIQMPDQRSATAPTARPA